MSASKPRFWQRLVNRFQPPPEPEEAPPPPLQRIADFKLAVLIDGDNALREHLPNIMQTIDYYGNITIRRIYGDWTHPSMTSWKAFLNHYAIQPVQQFSYTIGKNATDSALIIDAMDILHTNPVTGFFIISSDSDYTRLAARIRESGLFVGGIGESKTPLAFRAACDVFMKYTDIKAEQLPPRFTLPPSISVSATPPPPALPIVKPSPKSKKRPPAVKKTTSANRPKPKRSFTPMPKNTPPPTEIQSLLIQAYNQHSKGNNIWVKLSFIGTTLPQLKKNFNIKQYGYKQLGAAIYAHPQIFETKRQNSELMIRIKPEQEQ